jgi:hypothetical protein
VLEHPWENRGPKLLRYERGATQLQAAERQIYLSIVYKPGTDCLSLICPVLSFPRCCSQTGQTGGVPCPMSGPLWRPQCAPVWLTGTWSAPTTMVGGFVIKKH